MVKHYIIYALALLLAASCATDDIGVEEPQTDDDNGLCPMTFMARAAILNRLPSDGLYQEDTYPVDELFVTSFHRDRLEIWQWYFQDLRLSATRTGTSAYWYANNWYWPIQGEMEFLSYWSPRVYGSPTFTTISGPTGYVNSQMVVNARGGSGYKGLDGYTDFLYIAQDSVHCPQTSPVVLTYRHALAWITVSLQACVPTSDGSGMDTVATAEVIDKIKIQKIVIEDVSRKGDAYLVPGTEVAWLIDPGDIKDQIYTRPGGLDESLNPRGQYSRYTWEEVADGAHATVEDYITLSNTEQYLGLYTPANNVNYVGNGLLIIPQHKTAITVYYLIKDAKFAADGSRTDLEVAERYELRDNEVEWDPGKHYHYDIEFVSHAADLHNHIHINETTYEILYSDDNCCYDPETFGQVIVRDSEGNEYKQPVFILDAYHNLGSPFQDEMDYRNGGVVF